MNGSESRQTERASLFVLAEIRQEGVEGIHRIKVRNLSARGMMGEGTVRVMRGARIEINIRESGWVAGTVAWVQESRFGVAFDQEIDADAVRSNSPATEDASIIPAPRPTARGRGRGTVRKV